MNITFYCRKSKENRLGLAPIECCIIIKGERMMITLERKENSSLFDKMVNSKKTNELKDYLESVRTLINSSITNINNDFRPVTKEVLREYMENGGRKKGDSICDQISKTLESVAGRIGTDCTTGTYRKYCNVYSKFTEWIMTKGITKDDDIHQIEHSHIEQYKIYLLKIYDETTVSGMLQKLKTLFRQCGMENIFAGIKLGKRVKEVEFLTEEEIELLRNKRIDNERLERVRDCSLFQIYTGLAYCDMKNLIPQDIKEQDGRKYIKKERNKTGVEYTIPLMDDAVRILEKYDYRLPVLSNQKYNNYISELGTICGINKRLTSHRFRHTCACYLLNKGLRMETVSKILGHSTTVITSRVYARIVDKTVFSEMTKIGLI